MIIYNCSFMLERGLSSEFEVWFGANVSEVLVSGREARLTRVCEVPGDPHFSDQALTYAFQQKFENLEQAHIWADNVLMPFVERYVERFGRERAVSFSTILEEVRYV